MMTRAYSNVHVVGRIQSHISISNFTAQCKVPISSTQKAFACVFVHRGGVLEKENISMLLLVNQMKIH
jgi:hypothetical protein